MRVIIMLLASVLLLFSGCDASQEVSSSSLRIIASSFPCYDAARAVTGGNAEVTMLLPAGSDTHSYEPSIEDAMRISECDLFIYNGGPSDTWIEEILSSLDGSVTTFSLLDNASFTLYESDENVAQKEEEDSHAHHHVLDEHVWTSPSNEIAIIRSLAQVISSLDEENRDWYLSQAEDYAGRIEEIRKDFQSIVGNAQRKEIIVADRFPLLYFVTEFGLDWYAAYPGCSEHSEPAIQTVAFLIDKVREDEIPVILHMELSNTALSEVIADETGAQVLEFSSCHNVSKRQFDSGVTYVDLMRSNVEVLREALN